MPIYVEKIKDPKTGKMVPKLVNGQKQYYIRTYVEDDDCHNKQITRHNKHWLGRDGYNSAKQEEVRLKNRILISDEKKNNISLCELKQEYLDFCKQRVDPDTLNAKSTKLNHFCEFDPTNQIITYPNKPIKLLTKDDYLKWQGDMKNKKYYSGKKLKPYSLKRLNGIHNEITAMFDYGITNGYINQNIPRIIGKFGTQKEIKMSNYKNEYIIIDYSEYLRLLEASKDNIKYNIIFDLLFTRGPRAGEIRAFRIKDYNYKRQQLMVNHTLSKKNKLKDPKTLSSKSPIDLDKILNDKIKNMIDNLKMMKDFNEEWYLFGNKYMPISSHAMNYNVKKYFKIANINKKLRLHDFRHSCASWLFSIGTPITVISKILRHSDISTTMKVYTHLVEKDYNKSLLQLEQIRAKQDQTQDQTNN